MSTEEQQSEYQGIESLTKFYDENKKNISIAGIVLILLATGIWYYTGPYADQQEKEANDNFFKAERYYNIDSVDLALNGDGLNAGMMEIADDYGSTKTGQLAAYYTGRILLEKEQYTEALEYLESVSMDDEIMAAQVITVQGDCFSQLGEYTTAGDRYMKAANKRDNLLTTPYALLKAGQAYEEAGDFSDALNAYEKLSDSYSSSKESKNIEGKIARIKAKLASN